MGNKHNSSCREDYRLEFKLDVLLQGFRHDVVVADLCQRKRVPCSTYYEWRKRFLHGGMHRFYYGKTCGLAEQAKKLKSDNYRFREVLHFMMEGSRSRKSQLLSLGDIEPIRWMLRLMQSAYSLSEAENELGKIAGLATLLEDAVSVKMRERNYAISILAQCRKIHRSTIARFLHMSRSSIYRHWERFQSPDMGVSSKRHRSKTVKANDKVNIEAVFSVLHSPPSEFGINRTSWRMADLKKCLAEREVFLGQATIRRIIKAAGYTWRRAKIVLTSNQAMTRFIGRN